MHFSLWDVLYTVKVAQKSKQEINDFETLGKLDESPIDLRETKVNMF